MQQLEKDYENSGCQVIFQAAATGEGITQIEELLRGKTTIMAGPSGVGKSSTLNCISKENRWKQVQSVKKSSEENTQQDIPN